ncbi:hypothetical protein, partial [Streptomyces sp. S1A1-7]|uniref:hypothetical protein n=1 Tax=Streptomyces sp. S1A1-7 TaxID=2594459 RepID=UPI001F079B09
MDDAARPPRVQQYQPEGRHERQEPHLDPVPHLWLLEQFSQEVDRGAQSVLVHLGPVGDGAAARGLGGGGA